MKAFEASIDWCKGDELVVMEERIEPVQTEFGLWPRIVRHPRRWREKTLH
jgi:hypothetical protein